mmetsp:Transcript_19396/g.62496  ORF Transcript_19396/g.62496 Transcript_19396/m.62496 type:complete len:266 (+) Transcript_19396:1015-1812(+)
MVPQGCRPADGHRSRRPHRLPLSPLRVAPRLRLRRADRQAGGRHVDRHQRPPHRALHDRHDVYRPRALPSPQVGQGLGRTLHLCQGAQALGARARAPLDPQQGLLGVLALPGGADPRRQAHRPPARQGAGRAAARGLADQGRAAPDDAPRERAPLQVPGGPVHLPAGAGHLRGVAPIHALLLSGGADLLPPHPVPVRHGLDLRAAADAAPGGGRASKDVLPAGDAGVGDQPVRQRRPGQEQRHLDPAHALCGRPVRQRERGGISL